MWIIIVLLLGLFMYLFLRFTKIPKLGNMTLVTGGIKTGKTMLSVHLALRTYKRNLRSYYIRYYFIKFLRALGVKKYDLPEKPLLYSNVPLKCDYVPLTNELLLRKERFNYKSICYICEYSLVADSMFYKDDTVNENLLLFHKLFAHETHGGSLFIDTQSIKDCHFACKRCLSNYLYIHHKTVLPFFVVLSVREMYFSEDNVVNTFDDDIEENLQLVIVPKSVWKKYDQYAYSAFTDNLISVENITNGGDCLKVSHILTFKEKK